MTIYSEEIKKDKNGVWWLWLNYSEAFKLGNRKQIMLTATGAKTDCWTVEQAKAYFQSKQHDLDAFESDYKAFCD